MKTILSIILVSLALTGFGQPTPQSAGVNIVAPIPPEKITEFEMKVVIYNEATRSDNYEFKKLTETGWYVHSILPFGTRIGGSAKEVYKEDLLIVFIRPRPTPPKPREKSDTAEK